MNGDRPKRRQMIRACVEGFIEGAAKGILIGAGVGLATRFVRWALR